MTEEPPAHESHAAEPRCPDMRPEHSLRWIFQLWLWSAESAVTRFRYAVVSAIWMLARCRTGALGAHEQTCPEHGSRVVANSCTRRDCPRCVGQKSFKWSLMIQDRLLSCSHFHLVFTIPHVFLPYWRHNRVIMANLLFRAASETILELLRDDAYMGGVPAMFGVLHTHGSALVLHPHLHIVVSSAGISLRSPGSADLTLVWTKRPTTLLPYGVLAERFRGEFLGRLSRLADRNLIYPPKDSTMPELRLLISEQFSKPWQSWAVRVFLRDDVRPVIRYLSETIYGGPIRDGRIISVTPNHVTYSYRDWRDRDDDEGDYQRSPPWRDMTTSLAEFVRRFSEHVHEPDFKTVRYWGLLAPSLQAQTLLDTARAYLGQRPIPQSEPEPKDKEPPPVLCPHCSRVMEVRVLPPTPIRFSPAARAEIRARAPPQAVPA